eukprot:1450023-Amphidinium_carterae.1
MREATSQSRLPQTLRYYRTLLQHYCYPNQHKHVFWKILRTVLLTSLCAIAALVHDLTQATELLRVKDTRPSESETQPSREQKRLLYKRIF